MFDRLEVFEKKYEECNQKLYDPAVVSDPEAYAALMKEVKGLEPVVEKYKEYKKQKNNEEEAKQLLAEGGLEKDFREMVELELEEARESLEKISEKLKILLLPKDPNDDRSHHSPNQVPVKNTVQISYSINTTIDLQRIYPLILV